MKPRARVATGGGESEPAAFSSACCSFDQNRHLDIDCALSAGLTPSPSGVTIPPWDFGHQHTGPALAGGAFKQHVDEQFRMVTQS